MNDITTMDLFREHIIYREGSDLLVTYFFVSLVYFIDIAIFIAQIFIASFSSGERLTYAAY